MITEVTGWSAKTEDAQIGTAGVPTVVYGVQITSGGGGGGVLVLRNGTTTKTPRL